MECTSFPSVPPPTPIRLSCSACGRCSRTGRPDATRTTPCTRRHTHSSSLGNAGGGRRCRCSPVRDDVALGGAYLAPKPLVDPAVVVPGPFQQSVLLQARQRVCTQISLISAIFSFFWGVFFGKRGSGLGCSPCRRAQHRRRARKCGSPARPPGAPPLGVCWCCTGTSSTASLVGGATCDPSSSWAR